MVGPRSNKEHCHTLSLTCLIVDACETWCMCFWLVKILTWSKLQRSIFKRSDWDSKNHLAYGLIFFDLTVHFQHFVFNKKVLHFTENKIQWNQIFNFSTIAPFLLVSLPMLCLVTLCIRNISRHTKKNLCIFLCIFVQVQKRLLIQILTSQIDRRDYNLTGGTSCSRIIIVYILESQWKMYWHG